MTKDGIILGRQYDAETVAWSLSNGDSLVVAPADANRIGVIVACSGAMVEALGIVAVLSVVNAGVATPIATITNGWPMAKCMVDEYGSVLFRELTLSNVSDTPAVFGVTIIRQPQELPQT